MNISSLKSNKIETPKTPGGISKSLLTPCRRVGLSRNWRKSGPSPFNSPLSGSAEIKVERETKKRKDCGRDDIENSIVGESRLGNNDIEKTPSRIINTPKRKRSKILSAVSPDKDYTKVSNSDTNEELSKANLSNNELNSVKDKTENVLVIPLNSKSVKSKSKQNSSPVKTSDSENKTSKEQCSDIIDLTNAKENQVERKQKSPENLTKECIVVIQKKIFKNNIKVKTLLNNNEKPINTTSQTLFDSDSDDIPLCKLDKKENKDIATDVIPNCVELDDDNDFENKTNIPVKKLEDKTTSTSSLKKKIKSKKNKNELKPIATPKVVTKDTKSPSQSSIEDEDFDFDQKKTILIRKTYNKISKPLKAKSTGSVTQKDLDEIRSRIEIKKKLLLAKAMAPDTQELRDLIKKWQTGCQNALMELMELMKSKFPDKQNMDYSEMLELLKIPTALVGYDAENDCFNTPDDESIILSKFNDI